MEIKNFRKNPREGCLKASFTVVIPEWQMEIRNVCYFQKQGYDWFTMPQEVKAQEDGSKKYFPLIALAAPAKEKFEKSLRSALEPLLAE